MIRVESGSAVIFHNTFDLCFYSGEPWHFTWAADCWVYQKEESIDAPVTSATPSLCAGVPGPVHPQGTPTCLLCLFIHPLAHVTVSPVQLSPQQLCLCVQEYQGQFTFNTHLAVSPVCSSTWPPVYLHTWLSHLSTQPPVRLHTCLSTCLLAQLYSCLSHLSVCLSCYLFVSMQGFPQSDHLQGTPDCLTCLPSHLFICLNCVFYVPHLCLFWSPVSLAVLCMLILNNN